MKTVRMWADKRLGLCAALLIGAIGLFAAGGLVLFVPVHAVFCVVPLGIAGLAFAMGSSHAHQAIMILLPLWMMFAVAGGALAVLAGGALFLQWLVELARNTASDTGTLVYVSMAALGRSDKQARGAKGKGAPFSAAAAVSDLANDARRLFDEMKEAERHLSRFRKMADGLRRAQTLLGVGAAILCTTAGLVALILPPR